MNILFLSLSATNNIDEHGIYTDVLRALSKQGHDIYIISPAERRTGIKTGFVEQKVSGDNDYHSRVHLLRLRVGNIQKTNVIEKGIATILIEKQITWAIKKYFADVRFDLVLYPTPPITLVEPVEYVKHRDGAKAYLMLKDIFPQNAIDLGMLKTTGLKGYLYRWFRRKEERLYQISDKIGCMSQANCDYVLQYNSSVSPDKVEVCPNSVEFVNMRVSDDERTQMRRKYDIPLDKKVFVYGGNLGKPQGIPFLITCLKSQLANDRAYFLIVGDGTEFGVLEKFFNEIKPSNMRLMKRLPKADYDKMVAACDVGMIFLDHRFTIPNFPSRLLSYMQAGVPVMAVTDPNTDVGKVIVDGGFGWWCESNDVGSFSSIVERILTENNLAVMQERELAYLKNNYSVDATVDKILSFVGEKK